MLQVKHISKYYEKNRVLDDCSLSVAKGEIIGIMGESGSGKSTLARIIAGIEPATTGDILVYQQPYTIRAKQATIQMVFQDIFQSVNRYWTVAKILQEAKKEHIANEQLVKVLADVDLDESFLKKKPHELSGGQLQRVCIARALLAEPDIIIFDEALSALDPLIQGKLLKLLYQLHQQYQHTYIFISHDYRQCYAICHRILLMSQGKIVKEITEFE